MKLGPALFVATIAFTITVHAQGERGKAYLYPLEAEGQKTASGDLFRNADFTGGHARLPFGTIVRVTDVWTGKTVDVRINDRRSHRSQLIRISRAAGEKLGILQHGVADVTLQVVRPASPKELFSKRNSETKKSGGLFASKEKPAQQSVPASSYPPPVSQPLSTATVAPPAPANQVPQLEPVLVPLAAPTAPTSRFWLQFATFPDRKSAKEFAHLIQSRGAPTRVISDPNGLVHRVVSDHFFPTRKEAETAAARTARQVGFHSVIQGQ